LVRSATVRLLPFVDQVWQIYVLIFALQSASASFTPAFQATIPDILPDEAARSLTTPHADSQALAPATRTTVLQIKARRFLGGGRP
jgi:hypothetical protein